MFLRQRVAPAVLVFAFVGACSGSSTGPRYSGPPLSVSFNPTQVSQGDQTAITIMLPTNADQGGMPLILSFSGVGVGADTTTVPADSGGEPLQATLAVPSGSPDGALTVRVSLPTLGDTASAVLTVKDVVPPTVNAAALSSGVNGLRLSNLLVAGTTDSIAVTANDNHLLGWLGWSLNGPTTLADSVQAAAAYDSVMLPIAVPASLAGDSLTLTLFAVDADGNQGTTAVPALVSALTTHPVMSVPRGGRIGDIAFDSARGMVYLAKPDSQQVDVLSLSGMTYGTPIAVTGSPVAVDLTPGGDSLIVGLASPAAVAIVSLTSVSHPVLGTLQFDAPGVTDSLRSMRVMADNRAFAIVTHFPSYSLQAVMALNLGTGVNLQLDSGDSQWCLPRIARSGDRTHAFALNCGGERNISPNSDLYLSATDTSAWAPYWSPNNLPGNNHFTSASASGHILYQLGHTVIDSSTAEALTLGLDATYGVVIAPNGTDVYVGEGVSDTLPGLYLHYVLPRQAPSEIAIIPHPPYELAVSPDAATLIAITADTISAIDLTHSTPASAAQIARVRRLVRGAAPKTRVAATTSKKSDAFTVRLGGKTLRPIAFNRAPPAP